MTRRSKRFLLVEPVAKTPYPPLGLMKISTYLKTRRQPCSVFSAVGTELPQGLLEPDEIYVTSLFTWDVDRVVRSIQFYSDRFPRATIHVGGIAASLVPEHVTAATGIVPHVGLFDQAEKCRPDYSMSFGRRLNASISLTSRGCPRRCRFCSVGITEPEFFVKEDWERDIWPALPGIVFWDNNWLASPLVGKDCDKIRRLGKTVDFNQGLDARLYDERTAKMLSKIRISPIRFAFDDVSCERPVLRAIRLAKKYTGGEVCVYVLYNYMDTPEDFYHRISVLNQHGALCFPMEYRVPTASKTKFPGKHWNTALLRALKLSLIFYYRKGMITESPASFCSIYGNSPAEFVSRLYEIYEYDKTLKRTRKTDSLLDQRRPELTDD